MTRRSSGSKRRSKRKRKTKPKRLKGDKEELDENGQIRTHIPKKLTAPKLRAISFLLECDSVEEAARRAKVGRSSLYEWIKNPLFQKRLQESREALFYEGLDQLKGAMAKAARTLIKLLSSSDEGQRRLAAKTILDFGLKGFELKNLEERIVRLEENLDRTLSYRS